MAHTFEELSGMNVNQLREIAQGIEHEAVQGSPTMHKEELVQAICQALGIEARVQHKVVGINKADIKKEISKLKAQRDEALAARDHKQLKTTRRKIHRLKRKIHKATV